MNTPLLSICIPSFNRPYELQRLLESIDCNPQFVDIVICEDKSPEREKIRECVNRFAQYTRYRITYLENAQNLGFDGNLRRLVECASGEYIMFMGDDDLFVPEALDQFLVFLKNNLDKHYVLRSHLVRHPDGKIENFRYLPETVRLPAGEVTVAWLFKRSVTICGFTISRLEAMKYATLELDGTLLYQVYLMAQVCLRADSIYYNNPIVQAVQTWRDDKPMFGNAEAEKNRYKPGSISEDNSINFTKAYFEVTEYLDKRNGTNLTPLVRKDLSKYSYPFLSIQRKRGVHAFLRYAKRLEKEAGLGASPYFYLFKWGLVIFGQHACDRIIIFIKQKLGYTPNY